MDKEKRTRRTKLPAKLLRAQLAHNFGLLVSRAIPEPENLVEEVIELSEASKIGPLSRGEVYRLLRGNTGASLEQLQIICDTFGVTPSDLLDPGLGDALSETEKDPRRAAKDFSKTASKRKSSRKRQRRNAPPPFQGPKPPPAT